VKDPADYQFRGRVAWNITLGKTARQKYLAYTEIVNVAFRNASIP